MPTPDRDPDTSNKIFSGAVHKSAPVRFTVPVSPGEFKEWLSNRQTSREGPNGPVYGNLQPTRAPDTPKRHFIDGGRAVDYTQTGVSPRTRIRWRMERTEEGDTEITATVRTRENTEEQSNKRPWEERHEEAKRILDNLTDKIHEKWPHNTPNTTYTLANENKHGDKYAWGRGPSLSLGINRRDALRKVEDLVDFFSNDKPDCAPHGWTVDPDESNILVPSIHAFLDAVKHTRTGPDQYLIWGNPQTVAMGGYFLPDYQNPLDDRCIYIPWWWLERESDTEEVGKRIEQAEEYLYQHVKTVREKLGTKSRDDQNHTRQDEPPYMKGIDAVFEWIMNTYRGDRKPRGFWGDVRDGLEEAGEIQTEQKKDNEGKPYKAPTGDAIRKKYERWKDDHDPNLKEEEEKERVRKRREEIQRKKEKEIRREQSR